MKRVNNKGFSLFEMIAVIAVATLMTLFITISIGTNLRNQALRTGEELESLINQARTNALVKGSSKGYLNIAYVDGAYYTYIGEEITGGEDGKANRESVKAKGKKFCDGGMGIYFDGVSVKGSEDVLYLSFNQSTGGLKIRQSTGEAAKDDISVRVEKGKTSSLIVVDYVTGKVK